MNSNLEVDIQLISLKFLTPKAVLHFFGYKTLIHRVKTLVNKYSNKVGFVLVPSLVITEITKISEEIFGYYFCYFFCTIITAYKDL